MPLSTQGKLYSVLYLFQHRNINYVRNNITRLSGFSYWRYLCKPCNKYAKKRTICNGGRNLKIITNNTNPRRVIFI